MDNNKCWRLPFRKIPKHDWIVSFLCVLFGMVVLDYFDCRNGLLFFAVSFAPFLLYACYPLIPEWYKWLRSESNLENQNDEQ